MSTVNCCQFNNLGTLAATAVCSGRDASIAIATTFLEVATCPNKPAPAARTYTVPAGRIRIGPEFYWKVPRPELCWHGNGPWTIKLDVNVGDSNIRWYRCVVCHADSLGASKATLYDGVVNQTLNPAGVFTHNFTLGLVAQDVIPNSDNVWVLIVLQNMSVLSAKTVQIEHNELIATSFWDKNYLNRRGNMAGAARGFA